MTKLFKNSKSILSCVLALAVLAVSLFTGVAASHIHADAATAEKGIVDLLEFGAYLKEAGSSSEYYDSVVADNGETGASWDDPIIIDSAEEFVYLCKGATNNATDGKYYKVADGIVGFNLATNKLDIEGTLADNLDIIKGSGKNHASGTEASFQGHFDGNGVTVYGATINPSSITNEYIGIFSCVQGEVTIKNLNVNKCYFIGNAAAAGIVGYYKGEGDYTNNTSLTIENCSVTDCYIEATRSSWSTGVGAVVGRVDCPASYKDEKDENNNGKTDDTVYVNNKINVRNCYVNLDETYFVSKDEGGSAEGDQVCHGGVVGVAGTNSVMVSDCVVIGITPYATSISTNKNGVQHSGLESHFTNVYTTDDVAITGVYLGGTLVDRNFTNKVFPLTDAQLKGAAAVENMDLDWSVWMADANGYPELAVSHKNVELVINEHGTHSATCDCGFGGIAVDCAYVDGVCACGAELNCATRKTIAWDGTVAAGIAEGSGLEDDPYIINTVSEFAYVVGLGEATEGKYYKVADDIGAIVLQSADKADDIVALDSAAEVKAYFENGTFTKWIYQGWASKPFCGKFDGNGATIYGLYSTAAAGNRNPALFPAIDTGAVFKNVAIKNAYVVGEAGWDAGIFSAIVCGNSYGVKKAGTVVFDGCVVANCYLRYDVKRGGVLVGTCQGDVYSYNNCLIYGNDAKDTNGAIAPVVFGAKNDLKDENDEFIYCNYSNSIVMGVMPYEPTLAYRKSEPECFTNVYTDAPSGDVYNNPAEVFSDEQLKTVTVADLATVELGDAWINTDTYPELRAFHDEVFTGAPNAQDNYAGHTAACSCGIGGVTEPHDYEVVGEGWDAVATCKVCEFVCDHMGEGHYEYSEDNGDCVTDPTFTVVCECGVTITDLNGSAQGHVFTPVEEVPSDCQTHGVAAHNHCVICEKNFAVDADVFAPMDEALTDEDLQLELGDHVQAVDTAPVYIATEAGHQKVCGVCDKAYGDVEDHEGKAVADGANGHAINCTVAGCGYEAESAPHVFGDDSVCDTCAWECTSHTWVDDGEPVELDFMDKTEDACMTVAQKCDVCGIAGEDRVIGHVAGDWERPFFDRNQVPACASDGSHTEIQTCTVCMFELATRPVTDPKTGHAFSEVEATDPNCVYEGNIAHKYCPNCNYAFALDAADDEAYENALTDDELYIPADPEAHIWVEFAAGEADCENDGYSADHKFCSVCLTFVIGDEVTDIVVDYEKFYEREYADENDWVGTAVGFGAIADEYLNELYNEYWAQYLADKGIVLPEEPAEDASYEEWDAYWAEYYAALEEVDETEFSKIWDPISKAIWNEAYHQYFLAEAADEIEVEEALGHTLVKVDEVPATYEADGVKAHWACEDCDKLFADEEGTEEVTAEDLVIAKLVKEEEKPADKPADNEGDKTDGDSSDKSPATGESVASVAAVAALMGAAYVLIRKARKA